MRKMALTTFWLSSIEDSIDRIFVLIIFVAEAVVNGVHGEHSCDEWCPWGHSCGERCLWRHIQFLDSEVNIEEYEALQSQHLALLLGRRKYWP